MSKKIDLAGRTFGRLTVLSEDHSPRTHGEATWLCRCECGKELVTRGARLRQGGAKSCGCISIEAATKRLRTHGLSYAGEHNVWSHMKSRCYNPGDKRFEHYGGRGISVCPRWRDSFENFIEDMGRRSTGMTLDRIDVNGNYEPSNCRWATMRTQQRNRSNTVMLSVDGESRPLVEWAERFGIGVPTVRLRLKKGMTPKDALTTPVRQRIALVPVGGGEGDGRG